MTEHADRFDPRDYIPNLPRRPGVYRMYGAPDDQGKSELLYVGKARSLRDRVGNYFLASNVDPKVQALVANIARIEVTITNSETEALLLEYNLIKEHKPRYNIVLRDDKSFPYIYLPSGHEYPRLVFYRGARNLPGRYFGPFPSAGAVKETLQSVASACGQNLACTARVSQVFSDIRYSLCSLLRTPIATCMPATFRKSPMPGNEPLTNTGGACHPRFSQSSREQF